MRSGLLLSRMSGGDRKDGRISRDFFCVGRSTGGEVVADGDVSFLASRDPKLLTNGLGIM